MLLFLFLLCEFSESGGVRSFTFSKNKIKLVKNKKVSTNQNGLPPRSEHRYPYQLQEFHRFINHINSKKQLCAFVGFNLEKNLCPCVLLPWKRKKCQSISMRVEKHTSISRKNMISVSIKHFFVLNSAWAWQSNPSFSQKEENDYDAFAKNYDFLDGGPVASMLGIEQLRQGAVTSAFGTVLEVGVGTGLNLKYYDVANITRLDAIDLSPGMLEITSQRLLQTPKLSNITKLQRMNAENLQFPENSFDSVIDTFSLCVYQNPVEALKEMGRVCKPSGKIILLENNRADSSFFGRYQDATADTISRFGGKGCVYNQNVLSLVKQAGLTPTAYTKVLGGLFIQIEAAPPITSY